MVEKLDDLDTCRSSPPDPAIITQQTAAKVKAPSISQLSSLADLPCPDYDDYFSILNTMKPEKTFFPTLPLEISRGCWRSSHSPSSNRKGCAFCNLNIQWRGYRTKNATQVASEVDYLTSRHKALSLAFTDNLLPLKSSAEIFPAINRLRKNLKFFGEIRAITPRSIMKAMKSAGVHSVQIGIESLSTDLLNKLNKGTTAIQNLQIMRDCEELGIASYSNLILYFPDSKPEHVEETLRVISFALPFRPLMPSEFFLAYGSPVWHKRADYGVDATQNLPLYGVLFPKSEYRNLSSMIQSYCGDKEYQKTLWRPVAEKLKEWEKKYTKSHTHPNSTPILTYRDGRDFLILKYRKNENVATYMSLIGWNRPVYLFCCRHRSLKRIVSNFPEVGQDKILSFLKEMIGHKFMFEEKGRYLSLAVGTGDE